MDPINQLKNRVFKKERQLSPDDIPEIHHYMMKAYSCWIPIEEFKKIPLPTLWNLLELIDRDEKKSQREADKARNKRR